MAQTESTSKTVYTDQCIGAKYVDVINDNMLSRRKPDAHYYIYNNSIVYEATSGSIPSPIHYAKNMVTIESKPTTVPTTVEPIFESFPSSFLNISTIASKSDNVFTYEVFLISSARKRIAAHYSNKLADRLNYLYKVSAEESPEQGLMSSESLHGFIAFFASHTDLLEPELVLSPTGNICAEWHRLPDELFSVEFLPSSQVNYCVFASDPDDRSNINRSSGIVSANALLKIVEPFNILSWIIIKT